MPTLTNKKPDFEPGIRPCFAGVNTSCGKIGAETELTKRMPGKGLEPLRAKCTLEPESSLSTKFQHPGM